jgi:hypothetical protein
VTTTANPLTTNALGRFDFYVADGRYDITITSPQITSFTLADVEIVDTTEATPASDRTWNIGNVNITGSLRAGNLNNIRILDGVTYAQTAAGLTAADADLGLTPGEIWIPPGNYTFSSAPTISANHGVRFFGGTITVTTTGGANQFSNGASFICNGFGGPQGNIVVASTANISRLFTNTDKTGGQEYFYLDGCNVFVQTGAVISVATVDVVSVYVNSAIRNMVVNNNDTNPGVPAFRIAAAAGLGQGPIKLDDLWALHTGGPGFLFTDGAGSGASHIIAGTLTCEHQASGFHCIDINPTPGSLGMNVIIHAVHYENIISASSVTAGVRNNGGRDFILNEMQCFSTNLANKRCVWITNATTNLRNQIGPISNDNLVNPVLQDDLNGVTFGAVNMPGYINTGPTILSPTLTSPVIDTTTFASLGTPVNGTLKYCSDCTIANPCAGGGTGALAKRINGTWICN